MASNHEVGMGKPGDDRTKDVPTPAPEPRGDTNSPDADDELFLFPLEEPTDSGTYVETAPYRLAGEAYERSLSDGEAVWLELGRLRHGSPDEPTGVNSAGHEPGAPATAIAREVEHRLNLLQFIRTLIRHADERFIARRRLTTGVSAVESGVRRSVPSLDQRLGEVTRLLGLLSALETRAIALSGNQPSAGAPAKSVQPEHQGSELRVGIDLRVEHDDVQQHSMAQVLGDAARARDLLSALEARIATLTSLGDTLDRVVRTVEDLEGRVALAAARLDQLPRVGSEVEQSLSISQKISKKKNVDDRVSPLLPTVTLRQRWTAGFGLLAACVLLSVAVVRLRDRGVAPAEREYPRQTAWFGSGPSPLPSRSLPIALLPVPLQSFEQRVLVGRNSTFDRPSRTNRLSPPTETDALDGGPGSGASIAPREVAVSASRVPPATLFNGMLGVESWPPGAVVFINQRRVGETPLRFMRVSAGSHVVWVERQGYERWSSSVLVPDGQQIRVRATLLRSH